MKTVAAAVLILLFAGWSRASASGSQGLSIGTGTVSADGSTTGDINTATRFSLDMLMSTTNQTGIFSGMPAQNFGMVNFRTAGPVTFSDGAFGSFTAASLMEVSNTAGFLDLKGEGTFTPGTFETGVKGTLPGEIRLDFTQSPSHTGSISFSGTLDVSQTVVPEVPTVVLFGTGLLAFLLIGSRLRGKTWQQ